MKLHDFGAIKLRLSDRAAAELSNAISKTSQPVPLATILDTDENGLITHFQPANGMEWGLVFLIQNLMIHQRLELMDEFARKEGLIK